MTERTDRRGARPGAKGVQPYKVTDQSRARILAYSAAGLVQEQMAQLEGCSTDTIQRHYRAELEGGNPVATAKVAARLFEKALAGDTVAMLFWLKCRGGWVEPRAPQAIIGDASPDAPPIRAELSLKVEFVDPPAALPPPAK